MAANCLPIVMCALLGGGPAVVSPTPAVSSVVVTGNGSPLMSGEVACGCTEARYCFDAQDAWIHGYFQEVPAYGGFTAFRPYNYKHVLTQSSIVSGWGMSPTLPYSQSFWRRYQSRSTMTGENAPEREAASELPIER